MSVVRIPPTLRQATQGARQVEAHGATVSDLLWDVVRKFPELEELLFEAGELQPFVNVYLDSEDVRTLDGLETPVRGDSTLILLPAMAGG